MNSHLDDLWYAMQHPLGPSRGLDSYDNHQESVEKLIREMETRVHPDATGGPSGVSDVPV
jgi:hypothetical protein